MIAESMAHNNNTDNDKPHSHTDKTIQSSHSSSSSSLFSFVEVRGEPKKAQPPDRIQVLVVKGVAPRQCGPMLQHLSAKIPKDERLIHLKRVHRVSLPTTTAQPKNDLDDGPQLKRAKTAAATSLQPKELMVLVGMDEDETREALSSSCWLESFASHGANDTNGGHHPPLELVSQTVPGRPAQSKEELHQFNQLWPTIYFHTQSEQHKKQQLHLTEQERQQMVFGMHQAQQDAAAAGNPAAAATTIGAVILSPITGKVVAWAHKELLLQQQRNPDQKDNNDNHNNNNNNNPLLQTPVLLCIQGVSRLERETAITRGMDSPVFQKGQYLCNG